MNSQEQFEAAVIADWPSANLLRCTSVSARAGQYADEVVQRAWWGWQASRAKLVVKLPRSGCYAGYDNPSMMEARDVTEALEEVGIRFEE